MNGMDNYGRLTPEPEATNVKNPVYLVLGNRTVDLVSRNIYFYSLDHDQRI